MHLNKMGEKELQKKLQRAPKNPMLFSLVIHQILKCCKIGTLKKCRLVCKLWEEEANRIRCLKKYPIVISDTKSQLGDFARIRSNNVIIDPNVGAESFTLIKSVLHRLQTELKLKVQFLEIQSGPWTIDNLKNLLNNLPHLTELTLSEHFILPKMYPHTRLLKEPVICLYKLQSLHLNLSDEHLQNFANLEFLAELCTISPNLQKVTCDKSKFSEPGHPHASIFSKLLFRTVLEISNNGGVLNNLSHLDINFDLRDEDLDLLQKANLPLKSLHLLINSDISISKMDAVLTILQSTLKKLKITYCSSVIKLPSLEAIKNLKYLAIHGTGSEVMGVDNRAKYRRRSSFGIGFGPTANLLGSSDPSSLNSNVLYKYTDIDLDLNQTTYNVFNVVPVNLFKYCLESFASPLADLIELHLKGVYYIPKDVFNLVIFFPNLRQLHISFLDDNLLQSVIKSFPQLESFGATEGFFTDTGLTGISPQVQDIFKNIKVSQTYNTERLREFHSLLNLPNLKTVELGSPRVTSFGVINGISSCHSVQEFILNFPQMDDNSIAIFTQNPNWDSLTVKAGSFSDTMIQQLNKDSQRRKFTYRPDN